MKLSKKLRNRIVLAIIIFLAVTVLIVAYVVSPSSFRLSLSPSIVTPGWEIYDQIVGAQCDNRLYTGSAQSNQFTTPKFVSAPYWSFDVDNPDYGVPTMEFTIGDIHHVDFSGSDIPISQAASTLATVTRGSHTYTLDEHIYLFTLTMRSVADVKIDHTVPFTSMPYFYHETSWPKSYSGGLTSGGNNVGQPFDGGAYVAFVIDPWRGAASDNSVSAPANYTLTNGWAGIMNAYVLSVQQGQIANQYKDSGNSENNNGLPTPAADAPLMVKGSIAQGNQVPMFVNDNVFGTVAPSVNFDSSLSPDTRIQSTVVLYLPIYIFPGAHIHNNWQLISDAVYPADGYVMYNVRVDVLQTHDFTLQTAIQPPTPGIPTDYYTWSQDWWTSFLHGLDPFAFLGPLEPLVWWLVTVGIVIVIIVVLVAIFAPWILPRLAGTARSTVKAAQGK